MNRTPSMQRAFDDDKSEYEENSGSASGSAPSAGSDSVPQQILGAELDVSAVLTQALSNSSADCTLKDLCRLLLVVAQANLTAEVAARKDRVEIKAAIRSLQESSNNALSSSKSGGVVLKTNKVLRRKAYQLILSKQRTKCFIFSGSSKHVLAPHPKLLKIMRDQKAVSSTKSHDVQVEELNYNVGRMHSILCAKLKSLVFPESVKGNTGQIPRVGSTGQLSEVDIDLFVRFLGLHDSRFTDDQQSRVKFFIVKMLAFLLDQMVLSDAEGKSISKLEEQQAREQRTQLKKQKWDAAAVKIWKMIFLSLDEYENKPETAQRAAYKSAAKTFVKKQAKLYQGWLGKPGAAPRAGAAGAAAAAAAAAGEVEEEEQKQEEKADTGPARKRARKRKAAEDDEDKEDDVVPRIDDDEEEIDDDEEEDEDLAGVFSGEEED